VRPVKLRLLQRHERAAGNLDLDGDAARGRLDVDPVALARPHDDLFAERKAKGEVFQVGRRGHHDGVRDAVVDERDGDFVDHQVIHLGQHARAHAQHTPGMRGGRQRGGQISGIGIVGRGHRRR
jgi:hypothetical protein